jgi:hypothetical protein
VAAVTPECFPRELLSVYEKKLGKAEDTVFALRLGSRGKLVYESRSVFLHAHDAPPVAYAASAFRFGRAMTYSRRLINDNCRYPARPGLRDRATLLTSLAAVVGLAVWRGVTGMSKDALSFLAGVAMGAVGAVLNRPRAGDLVPGIDWVHEGEAAMQGLRAIQD